MAEVPAPPYVGPPNRHGPRSNKPINRIVIHSTVGPSGEGSARNIADYFRSTSRAASAHYIVDSGEAVQSLYDSWVGYHAPPNSHSLGIEMCDHPGRSESNPNPVSRWESGAHRLVLLRTAILTAGLCKGYGIPIRKLSSSDLRAGKKGICGHVDVSYAWHQTSHWDPGEFPWSEFIRLVKKAANGEKILDETIDAGSGGGGSSSGGGRYEEPGSKHKVGSRVMGLYDGGTDVKWLQEKLDGLGFYDGDVDSLFGPKLKDAVEDYQRSRGLLVDGLAGENTISAIKSGKKAVSGSKPAKGGDAPPFPLPDGHWYAEESSNPKNHSGYYEKDRAGIHRFQSKLEDRGWSIKPDGIFGPITSRVVGNFQEEKGLRKDYAVGEVTWPAIWEEPVT